MKLTFLGTGTSTGIPVIGCNCRVCTSSDKHDKRLRTSALLETTQGTRILFDCGPDFRQQILPFSFRPFDAILLTHEHYDHVGGLDDLRPYSIFGSQQIYANAICTRHIKERMPYCFAGNTPSGVPQLCLHEVSSGTPFNINELEILPIEVMHGPLPILSYRIGSFAYITDLKTISPESEQMLHGVDTLVLNALRHTPHVTHQTIDEAVALSQRIGAKNTYLIHFNHDAPLHREALEQLPKGIWPAYDGLQIEV
ncbi:MAG: MBL fold metallo-hydrolase [Bacteroidaceae bacterium]|nr:MBL fold metallo-hydrolase [Bacteroidaceae bacterium]